MCRQDGEIRQQIREVALGFSKAHDDTRVVRGYYGVESRHLVLPGIAGGRIARGVERPGHIPSRGGTTIMPAHSGLKVESECATILRPAPGPSQVGLRRHAAV